MKKYLTLFAAAMMVTACQNDEATTEVNHQPGDAITIGVDESSLTRAMGEFNQGDIGLLAQKGFGVFACYTGKLLYENTTVSADYMYNQKVIGELVGTDTYTWVYTPVKYWPNSIDNETGSSNEYVSFFAYAPYEANPKDDGRAIIDMSKKYDLGDPWINFRLPADPWGDPGQVDLMYGVKFGILGTTGWEDELFIDQKKSTYGVDGKMNFQFRHALACIGDVITVKLTPEMATYIDGYATITLNKLTIVYKNLTTKGRLVLNSPSGPNWKEIISGELTTERTYTKEFATPVTLTTTAQELSTGEGLFYIPLRVKGTEAPVAEVTVDYTIDNGVSTYTGQSTATIPMDLTLEGQKQGIDIQVTKGLDLLHPVFLLGSPAEEPSYSRQAK